MTNEQAIETLLRSDREVKADNITTHYNEHDDENLLRQYGTLIATRKGKKVTFTGKKYSKTTTALTNSIKSLASKYGFVIEKSEEFAKGSNVGYVGKVELVWKKLSSSEKIKFLYDNFTPQITPRSQELLVGKTYKFLPKNVKIVLNSKYANVEEYAKGANVDCGCKFEGGGNTNGGVESKKSWLDGIEYLFNF